jgi:2-polyprenyl-3-methyl-5-hydroxy-6-metoxy-1,4-benzoquinol methylase
VTALDVRHSAKAVARRTLLAGLQRLTGRTAVLLPPEAGTECLLDARAPYRIANGQVDYEIRTPGGGTLDVLIRSHVSIGPAPILWRFASTAVGPAARLVLRLQDGGLAVDGIDIGRMEASLPQRFTTELTVRGADRRARVRRLGHYVVRAVADESYFTGAHYRDYEAQAQDDVVRTMSTLRSWGAASPLLDIGCATGLLLAACSESGIDAFGVDASQWAVESARTRVAPQQVVQADVERDVWPNEVSQRRFRTIVMNAVLEHVQDPALLLARIASLAEPGALLFLTTSNANSLTRWLFGSDWEGLADPTHKSADMITPVRLTQWLDAAGWHVEHLTTHSVWDDNPDPVHATLRDIAAADARFRQLLAQFQRGDFLECVARRRAS